MDAAPPAPRLEVSVRNTFIHVSSEGVESTPGGGQVRQQAGRARTGPADLFTDALLAAVHEAQQGAGVPAAADAGADAPLGLEKQHHGDDPPAGDDTPLERCMQHVKTHDPFEASPCEREGLPTLLQHGPTEAHTAKATPGRVRAEGTEAYRGASEAPPVRSSSVRFDDEVPAATGWPAPPARPAAPGEGGAGGPPSAPWHARQEPPGREAAAPLTVSVRNTFLHVDEPVDGEEPAAFRQGRSRSKTGPASLFAGGLIDCLPTAEPVHVLTSSLTDHLNGRAAFQPWKVSLVPEPAAVAAASEGSQAPQPPRCRAAAAQSPGQAEGAQAGLPAAAAPCSAPGRSSRRRPEQRTTVVLQNLPLNYRRPMLLRMLDSEGFSSAYDFVYLPMDFNTRAGFGYAFVNLVDASVVPRFWRAFDGYCKWVFRSTKVCRVAWSEPHQGLKAHVRRYRNSPLMHESVPDEYRPVLFQGGARVAFPPPTRALEPPSQKVSAKAPRGRRGSGQAQGQARG